MPRFIRGCPGAQSLWKEEKEAGPAGGEARPPCSLSGNSVSQGVLKARQLFTTVPTWGEVTRLL